MRLLLHQLNIPFEYIELDILRGETRTPEFLAKNSNGRIPVLEIEPSVFLAESNAILIYLSRGTDYLPCDRISEAKVMQWLFFEQYSHEPHIATSRFWISILKQADQHREALVLKQQAGYAALGVMEQRLSQHSFLVDDRYTIADMALFAYTHVAHEEGFSLEPFPGIRAWIERVQQQPGHIAIVTFPKL